MRFQVPQFIDVEDKIFGPLTIKQFIYIAGGVGVMVILFTILPKFLAFIIGAPFLGIGLALAFYKPNNRPFIFALEAMFHYYFGERLYVWKKMPKERKVIEKEETSMTPQLIVPSLSGNKLKDMNWSLDVKRDAEKDKTSGV